MPETRTDYLQPTYDLDDTDAMHAAMGEECHLIGMTAWRTRPGNASDLCVHSALLSDGYLGGLLSDVRHSRIAQVRKGAADWRIR